MNGRIIDITGNKYGRWTVIGHDHGAYWLCECECGKKKLINKGNLIKGKTRSCGCLRRELQKLNGSSNGNSHTKLYYVWLAMRNRCYRSSVNGYQRYGGRGITVCDEWRNSYVAFEKWAFANGYREGLQIDRTDNNGNYEPSNCRWSTKLENANNTSKTVYLDVDGEKISAAEASKRYGIRQATITDRLRNGWTPSEAVMIQPHIGNNQNTREEFRNGNLSKTGKCTKSA